MTYYATLGFKQPMSQKSHEYRDAIVKDFKGVYFDIYQLEPLLKELENNTDSARNKLKALAKKAGLQISDKPDLSYGYNGGKEGPLVMWFQISV